MRLGRGPFIVVALVALAALLAAPAQAGKKDRRDDGDDGRDRIGEVVADVVDEVTETVDDVTDAADDAAPDAGAPAGPEDDAEARPEPSTVQGAGAPAGAGGWEVGGIPCRPIGVPTAAPFGAGSCPGVRPGALVETPSGFCTFNFVFRGSDGRTYVGTAGHCVLGEGPLVQDVGERRWRRGRGPVAKDSEGDRIGEFAYAVYQEPRDFALVRLDRGVRANPAMCHFGGPTGVNTARSSSPVVLQHFGQGDVVSAVLPARTEVAPNTEDRDQAYAHGVAFLGDSGSGVEDASGRAFGVLVSIGVGVDGVIGITRIEPQRSRASKRLGIGLKLQQADPR
jgi:hypothetical protein